MPIGPGRYDDLCQAVIMETHAVCAVIAVIGGNRGNGFSVASIDPDAQMKLPALLRAMADQIEASTS